MSCIMEAASKTMPAQTSLFQVYLRLRPPVEAAASKPQSEQWLIVEPPTPTASETEETNAPSLSTHITLQPPADSRKRAIERFGFTKIFREDASQLDVFEESGAANSVKNLLYEGRDGLIATLGVTGSGKSHTILGSRSQRGVTQMTLDILFRSIGQRIRRTEFPDIATDLGLIRSLQLCDPSEAQIVSATSFLDSMYGDYERGRNSRAQTPMVLGGSRAQTPMTVRTPVHILPGSFPSSPSQPQHPQTLYPRLSSFTRGSTKSLASHHAETGSSPVRLVPSLPSVAYNTQPVLPSRLPFWNRPSNITSTFAKLKISKDSMHLPTLPRRHLPTRPSALPQFPDVSNYAFEVDHRSDYVVLISMYEVYNDRIFDLLSSPVQPNASQMMTRHGAALQRGLMRRPLLFKSTEMSPDRKVVAGLRKIVCGSYDEAMMVLETGLLERRVAGTGSNSVSSRSHGFFCIEVKQNSKSSNYGLNDWSGGTLSIVDLAGSERARNAKTTGSTLAEAGKINESLMYLGQCLQVQSDCQQDGSKPIVPFRQCKLTELLFSNSFPSSSSNQSTYRTPQKAIMIVTADPHGDFNATSQILRYSALAREVTVPRIPSITSTILNGGLSNGRYGGGQASGRSTPYAQFSAEELEQAANEISRLNSECEQMTIRLAEEEIRRTEADFKLQAAEERALIAEQEIREECWSEMEARMEEEKARWRIAWEEERARGEKYLDGKIDILERGVATFEIRKDVDAGPEARAEAAERENETLRARIESLERDLQQRSPTKKIKQKSLVLQENANTNPATNPFLASLRGSLMAEDNFVMPEKGKMMSMDDISPRKASLRGASILATEHEIAEQSPRKVSVPKTPATAKKQRKLTTRKWDLGDVGSDGEY